MANVNCLIVNPTAVAYSNVNAAGDDIPAYSAGKDGKGTICVLSDAEVATFFAANPTALILACTTAVETTDPVTETRRLAAKILKLGYLPSQRTAETIG
jgi:hypothetical protein